MKKILLAMSVVLAAHASQAVILRWYIDNEVGSPDYDYAQLVAVSADKSITLYSYLIEMDAAGQHEVRYNGETPITPATWADTTPEYWRGLNILEGSWSESNLEEYMTYTADGTTDPAVGWDPERGYDEEKDPDGQKPVFYNFNGYSFYFRMLKQVGEDSEGYPVTEVIEDAVSEVRVFPDGDATANLPGMTYERGDRYYQGDGSDPFYFDDAAYFPSTWIININPQAVPEPATGALALVGIALLFKRRRG